jgi:hypothetical protein
MDPRLEAESLNLRVSISGQGFRVAGFGLRVSVSRFRVPGFGFPVPGSGLVSGFGFRVWV